MIETLNRQLEFFTSKLKKYTGKVPRVRNKSSLHKIIKIKEQAERFMRMLEFA
jgi:hypothetical protein